MLLVLCFNPVVLLVFTVLLLIFFVRYMKTTYSFLEKLNIPGPKPVWLFGNALEFRRKNVLDVFTEWKEKYGSIYGFYEGLRPGIVVNDPDMAREILSKNFDKFHMRSPYRPFLYYPDNLNLTNISGEHWKGHRSLVMKTLNVAASMKEVMNHIHRSSTRLLESVEEHRRAFPGGFNVSDCIYRCLCDTMMAILLNMGEGDMRHYGKAIYEYTKASNWSAAADNQITGLARLFPSLAPFLKLFDREHKKSHDTMLTILRQYLSDHIHNQNDVIEDKCPSLLSHLARCTVKSRDMDGSLIRRRLSDDEMLAHILSLFSETYQTTGSAVLFMMYNLALHQDLQQELYDEVCRTCGTDVQDELNASSLQSMVYFDMFFNETMRLHPPAPGVMRVCTENCTIKGVNFVSGTNIRIMTCTMYHDKNLYPDPEKFIPERFSEKERSARDGFSFMPFGQGPRMCPGTKLAMMEVKVIVVKLLRKYSIHTTKETEIPLKTALRPSLTPANGIHVQLKLRTPVY